MKQLLKKIVLFILSAIYSISTFSEDFPLRSKYSNVNLISLSEFNNSFSNAIIVDVRSKFEYNVIHIEGSINIPVSHGSFAEKLELIVKSKGDLVVTYCNGHTCAKSYKAVTKAMKRGFSNIFCFDAGVFVWAKKYPHLSNLLGRTPADKTKLISDEQFEARNLDKDDFAKEVDKENSFLIDIREPFQRNKDPKFSKSAVKLGFDKFVHLLKNDKFKKNIYGKRLLIFDAVGKQNWWIQYHLQDSGIKDYYFLKNGVWSFFGHKGANK